MDDAIVIRALTGDDLALLCDADRDVFDNPVQQDLAEAFLTASGHILVAAISAKGIVGFASSAIIRDPDKPPQLFVNEVGVATGYQRLGLARRIFEHMAQTASARGCVQMWVVTDAANAAARLLYTGLHATETSDLVMYDWDLAADA